MGSVPARKPLALPDPRGEHATERTAKPIMNPIEFPELGLTFHIQRVALSLGGKDIYWYGIIIAIGFLLGITVAAWQGEQMGMKQDDIIDTMLISAPIGIICARIYYVVFYLELYTKPDGSFNWSDAIAIWDGGIAIYGGIIGGTLSALVICKLRKISFPLMADSCCYALLVGQLIGRWGNFVNQEAYGSRCTMPWRMGLTLTNGEYIEVHPTFLYESLWNLLGLMLMLLVIRRFRRFDGMLFCFYLFWYGFGRFWIEGLRTDSLYFFNTGLRVSQLVAVITMTVSTCVFFYKLIYKPLLSKKREQEN